MYRIIYALIITVGLASVSAKAAAQETLDLTGYQYDTAFKKFRSHIRNLYRNEGGDNFAISYRDPETGAPQSFSIRWPSKLQRHLEGLADGQYAFEVDAFTAGTLFNEVTVQLIKGDGTNVAVSEPGSSTPAPAIADDTVPLRSLDYTGYSFDRGVRKFRNYLGRLRRNSGADQFNVSYINSRNGEDAQFTINSPGEVTAQVSNVGAGEYTFTVKAFDNGTLFQMATVLINRDGVVEEPADTVPDSVIDQAEADPADDVTDSSTESVVDESTPVTGEPVVDTVNPSDTADPLAESSQPQEPEEASVPDDEVMPEEPVVEEVPDSFSITLEWSAPASRENGNALLAAEISGYEIYYLDEVSGATDVIVVNNGTQTSLIVDDLPAGTHYFAISAIDSEGLKSEMSSMVSAVF